MTNPSQFRASEVSMKLPLAAAALLALAVPVRAKVVFTGYGDLRYDAGTRFTIAGPPATLTRVGTSGQTATARGFGADALGLFASTQLQENLQFLMDVTFRSIGSTVGQLSLQYAYLDWTPDPDSEVEAGRITLPFGYFNQNRFYGFQRYELSAPVFQSSILGLPIADWGVSGRRVLHLRPFDVEAAAYVVNGYGAAQTQPTVLRSVAVPGALSLTSNLRASDSNQKPAVGARLSLQKIAGLPVETGLSYYRGEWDTSGLEPMYMLDYHLHAAYAGLDLLFEALHLGVRGDTGFAQSLGSPNWSTDGGFATLSYDRLKVSGRTLAPYARFENYRSRPDNGDSPREILRGVAAGAALKLIPQLTLKAEYLRLAYMLPDVATGGSLSLTADAVDLAGVFTF